MIRITIAALALVIFAHAPVSAQTASSGSPPAAVTTTPPAALKTAPPQKSVFMITLLPLPGARLAPAKLVMKTDTIPTKTPTKEIVPGPAKKK